MRRSQSDTSPRPSAVPLPAPEAGDHGHPVLDRALEAHRGDQRTFAAPLHASGVSSDTSGARIRLLRYSEGFLGDARRAGVTASEVRSALGSGVRTRSWDGCLLVQDWFQGVELTLDPSGRFGLGVRRTDLAN